MSRTSFICPVNGVQCNHPDCSVRHCREAAHIRREEEALEHEVTSLMKARPWIRDRRQAAHVLRKIKAGKPLSPDELGI
jgi:hypothetical protein